MISDKTGWYPCRIRRRILFLCAVLSLMTPLFISAEGIRESNDPPPVRHVEGETEKIVTPVSVVLEWVPNTNHTGVFVALEKGWYMQEGLDLDIVGPLETTPPLVVASGRADFGFAPQEMVTFARTAENPLPVQSIAAVIPHNTSGFIFPMELNISSAADFEGKTYGGWGSSFENALLQAVMEKEGGEFSSLKIVNIGTADLFSSFNRGIDFRWVFYGWDGIRSTLEGREFGFIPLTKIDPLLDYYTPTIICSSKTLAEKPETVKAFLRATARGYVFASENPGEAADIVLRYNSDLDREFVKASQEYISRLYRNEEKGWGFMEKEKWENFGSFLEEYGLLGNPFVPEEAFTNEFLPVRRK